MKKQFVFGFFAAIAIWGTIVYQAVVKATGIFVLIPVLAVIVLLFYSAVSFSYWSGGTSRSFEGITYHHSSTKPFSKGLAVGIWLPVVGFFIYLIVR